MTTTISSSSGRFGSMYRMILKRNIGYIILSTLVVFLFIPLQYIFAVSERWGDNREFYNTLEGYANLYNEVSFFFLFATIIVFPVLTASMLFQFLHDKRASDIYHSLPIKRPAILLANLAAGMTIMAIPLAVAYLTMPIAGAILRYPILHPLRCAVDFLCVILTVFVFYTIAILCAVCTGTNFDGIVFSIVLPFLIPVLIIACRLIMSFWAFGVADDTAIVFEQYLVPLVGLIYLDFSQGELVLKGILCTIFWAIAAVGIFYGAVRYYQRRRNEVSGTLISQSLLKRVMKCSGIFLISLIFGYVFMSSISYTNDAMERIWFTVGCGIGAVVSHMVIEAVLARGFTTMKKNIKWIACSAAAMVLLAGPVASVVSYAQESYIPSQSNVKEVSLESRPSRYIDIPFVRLDLRNPAKAVDSRGIQNNEYRYYWGSSKKITLSSQESISRVLDIHRQILADYRSRPDKHSFHLSGNGETSTFTYNLKFGFDTSRFYPGLLDNVREQYIRFLDSEEYVRQVHPLFFIETEQIQSVSLFDPLMTYQHKLNPGMDISMEDLKRLQDALCEDILAQDTMAYLDGTEKPIGNITFILKPPSDAFERSMRGEDVMYSPQAYVEIMPGFSNTLAVLRDLGLDGNLNLDTSRIQEIYLSAYNHYLSSNDTYLGYQTMTPYSSTSSTIYGDILNDLKHQEEMVMSDWFLIQADTADLNTILEQSDIARRVDEKKYIVYFAFKDENGDMSVTGRYLHPEDVPEPYRSQINQILESQNLTGGSVDAELA